MIFQELMQMKCAWNEVLAILPQRMKREVDLLGKETGQELRLRLDKPPQLRCDNESHWLSGLTQQSDLDFVVNAASGYSPWTATSIAKGYLTAPGGHRIGLCGEVYGTDGQIKGIRNVTSLNIRIARDFDDLIQHDPGGNILILGPPGSGKTTLLRSLCRLIASRESISVVDERDELFPKGMERGKQLDVLSGCGKSEGIAMVLRTMGPKCIAVDEITEAGDCEALQSAAWCGVRLLATAHASGKDDLLRRKVYRPLIETGLFDRILVLRSDKKWSVERLENNE